MVFLSCSKQDNNLHDSIFEQDNNSRIEEFDNNTNDSIPFEKDWGVILSKDDTNLQFHKYIKPDELGETTEKVFTNSISGNEIYYTGIDGSGEGFYWIKDGTQKIEIWKKNIKQDAVIYWHGKDIAAIFFSGNFTARAIAYYDFKFKTNTIVGEPRFVDPERHLVVSILYWQEGHEINLIDLENSKIIKSINFFGDTNFEPTNSIGYEVELNDDEMIIYYNFYNGIEGVKKYNYNR
jgi:hypothetical protein